jgi:lysophospholipase L1-like esterase
VVNAPRLRFRRIAGLGVSIAFSVALTWVLLEAVLRLTPGLLPPRYGNAVYAVYGDWPGAIHIQDKETRVNFMRPDFQTRAYWNGYWWEHRTDDWGFRNPPGIERKEWLLLGDSMIYGHGVEEQETVAHFLRADHHIVAYNMGRTADSLFQEYLLARLYVPRFRPDVVVLCVFLNDFEDLSTYRQPEQIARAPEIDQLDYAALFDRVRNATPPARIGKQLQRSKAWRLGRAILKDLRKQMQRSKGRLLDLGILENVPIPAALAAAPDAPPVVPFLALIEDDARFAPLGEYYRRVLTDLALRVRADGAQLVVVQLDLAEQVFGAIALPAQARVRALLDAIGAAADFPVLSTQSIFRDCAACFLPNDGHLNAEGHHRLADFLAREIPPLVKGDRTIR